MDGAQDPSAREEEEGRAALVTAQAPARGARPLETLRERIGPGEFALICLFVSPEADFDGIVAAAARAFPGQPTVACTTAGEIGADGYDENQIVAVAYPAAHFAVTAYLVEGLDRLDTRAEIDRLLRARMELASRAPEMAHEFAFLMVDGLSLREDELAAMLASGLGSVPFFGGSAGDGTRFRATRVAAGGRVRGNAAVVTLVRTHCPVRVFSLDHLTPTGERMVVTGADPARRIVRSINAEPAAQEYARIVGKDPGQLDQFTFAAHPVVVRVGGQHHVRAIQQVTPAGELIFFSAIDEGMVLSTAEPQHMARHLDAALEGLGAAGAPAAILACDCLLRRLEAGEKQMSREISEVLQRHRVTGFSTYGEQIGPLHVNHTMTGVAIYPPEMPGPGPARAEEDGTGDAPEAAPGPGAPWRGRPDRHRAAPGRPGDPLAREGTASRGAASADTGRAATGTADTGQAATGQADAGQADTRGACP